jgi:thiamine kinase-like enzyme
MEDLKAQGFSMAERIAGLDMKHCLLVMRQLGRYHAASAVLHEKEPKHSREFLENIYTTNPPEAAVQFFKMNAENVANEVAKWPDYKERFYEKLLKIADNAYTYIADSVKRDEEEFNVLCHGDLWLNNMMFRYSGDTGEVMNIR